MTWECVIKLLLPERKKGPKISKISAVLQHFKVHWLRDAPTDLTVNNCTFCPHCICVFCIYRRTNSGLCHLEHKPIGFYNPDKKCLLRGTNWVFKSSMRFVLKGLPRNTNTYQCFIRYRNSLPYRKERGNFYLKGLAGFLIKEIHVSNTSAS